MLTMEDLMPRVEKGAAWLDAKKPGWFNAIDLEALALEDCARCALGQVFGDYNRGVAALVGRRNWMFGYHPESGAHGFALSSAEQILMGSPEAAQFFRVLRECWVTVILERRFAATVTERTNAPETASAVESPVRA